MNRRQFIAQSSCATLGAWLSPPLYASPKPPIKKKSDKKVLIIGAGAAGLYAGYLLQAQGIPFRILEASKRYGGRLGKLEGFADFPLDLGAEWLHGKKSLVREIIKQSKTKIAKDNSEIYYWYKNRIVKTLPRYFTPSQTRIKKLPDISYQAYAAQQGYGEEYRYIIEQIAGDHGADSSLLSVKWNALEGYEWSSGNRDYKFENTYFDLIDQNIAQAILGSIQLNTPAQKIDYSQDKVLVTDSSGKEHPADKVLVTVPLRILQDGDIEFTPPLAQAKIEAFHKIGMGAGMKVFLKFKEKFYHPNLAGGKICAAYADETIAKQGKDQVLLAFLMGKQAEYLTSLGSPEAIQKALLQELDTIYAGKASQNFLAAHIQNWTLAPYIKGAYSYSKIGIGNARSVAASTVQDKIFFAGEAMNLHGHHQTVHGAMETASEKVQVILKSIQG